MLFIIMTNKKYLLSFVFLLGGMGCVSAQTYLYKRVMIVKNGIKSKKNDDAHFLTFNSKGFYESDKNGYENSNSSFIEFTKNENNLHCYFGNGYYGFNHFYFSKDYSRLNVKIDNTTTYVYQREFSGTTTATRRKIVKSNNANNSTIISSTITSPPVINGSSDNSSSSHESIYKTCHICNGTGKCQSCKGTGVKFVTGGSVNYVPCGGCSNANGNGRCYMCLGRGKI